MQTQILSPQSTNILLSSDQIVGLDIPQFTETWIACQGHDKTFFITIFPHSRLNRILKFIDGFLIGWRFRRRHDRVCVDCARVKEKELNPFIQL